MKVHNKPVLEVRNLRKTYSRGSVVAMDKVYLEVMPGEIIGILGPSGCGKTTLLRNIAGLDQPDSGDVLLQGRSVLGVAPHKRNIGLVFQDLALFPHKNVFENVAFGLRMQKTRNDEVRRRVHEILKMVELPPDDFAERMPGMLSGGQRQRVALARTLVMQPYIVLFDEPMASLDRRLRDRLIVEVRRIQKRIGLPAIYVTHDQEAASFFADKLALMERGNIVQGGTYMEVYRQPKSKFAADFLGNINFFSARVVSSDASVTTVRLYGREIKLSFGYINTNLNVTLGMRFEDLRLSRVMTDLSIVQCKLITWGFNTGMFWYRGILDDNSEVTVCSRSEEFTQAVGTKVWIETDPKSILFFNDQ